MEYILPIIAMCLGVTGVTARTRDENTGKLTRPGEWTIVAIALSTFIGLYLQVKGNIEKQQEVFEQQRRSWEAEFRAERQLDLAKEQLHIASAQLKTSEANLIATGEIRDDIDDTKRKTSALLASVGKARSDIERSMQVLPPGLRVQLHIEIPCSSFVRDDTKAACNEMSKRKRYSEQWLEKWRTIGKEVCETRSQRVALVCIFARGRTMPKRWREQPEQMKSFVDLMVPGVMAPCQAPPGAFTDPQPEASSRHGSVRILWRSESLIFHSSGRIQSMADFAGLQVAVSLLPTHPNDRAMLRSVIVSTATTPDLTAVLQKAPDISVATAPPNVRPTIFVGRLH